ncbi:MAG TPA: DUF2461 domain-containing protein [Bacteroidales bacterium]|nr:DUF2461 domain-containing protein [Bacteroidales bacterium]HRS19650.1 DUF2461 domain-containing protein [Bacteroidales bacterium]
MKEILDFLKLLCVNNNREWFHANKALYDARKLQFEAIVEKSISDISQFDSAVKGLTAKDCIYRIHRDIRFSADKTPYKNHIAAYIAPGGKKSYAGGYYLHIEPENSMIAGGIYMPPPDVLFTLRTHVHNNCDEFLRIVTNESFVQTFGSVQGETLQSMPRGFSKDSPCAAYIKHKSLLLSVAVSDEQIESPDFYDYFLDVCKHMKEFNSFCNSAICI